MPGASSDPFYLERFVKAQDSIYDRVREELGAGQKQSHWMWFVFPQIRGLGSSPMAVYYAIGSLEEARAYLAHPVLGRRLEAVTRLVLSIKNRSLYEIFGSPDDAKFRSSMTLFARAAPPGNIFEQALAACCVAADERTDALLSRTDI